MDLPICPLAWEKASLQLVASGKTVSAGKRRGSKHPTSHKAISQLDYGVGHFAIGLTSLVIHVLCGDRTVGGKTSSRRDQTVLV